MTNITNTGKHVKQLKLLMGLNVHGPNCLGKWFGSFLKSQTYTYFMIFSLLGISLHKKNEIICLWYYPREMKSYVDKDIYMNVHISLLVKTPNWKQPKCPQTSEWITWCIHTMKCSSARKSELQHRGLSNNYTDFLKSRKEYIVSYSIYMIF